MGELLKEEEEEEDEDDDDDDDNDHHHYDEGGDNDGDNGWLLSAGATRVQCGGIRILSHDLTAQEPECTHQWGEWRRYAGSELHVYRMERS